MEMLIFTASAAGFVAFATFDQVVKRHLIPASILFLLCVGIAVSVFMQYEELHHHDHSDPYAGMNVCVINADVATDEDWMTPLWEICMGRSQPTPSS